MVVELLVGAGLTGAMGGAIAIWLLRNWFLTRLSASVKHEYESKLEKLRCELQANRERDIEGLKGQIQQTLSVRSAVQAAFAQSHLAAQDKRLDAINAIWKSFLHTRDNRPSILSIVELYKPSEYQLLFDHDPMQTRLEELSPQGVKQFSRTKDSDIELARPFVGEYLWSILYAHEAVSVRMVLLLWQRRLTGTGLAWFEDETILRVMRAVATEAELQAFRSLEFGHVTWFRNLIERKFLLAAARIISGEASTDIAIEQATRIFEAASALKPPERPT